MFSHVTWHLFSVRHSHLVSSVSGWWLLPAFPLPRILLVLLPHLYFLPGYWSINILLNQCEWQSCTVYKSINSVWQLYSNSGAPIYRLFSSKLVLEVDAYEIKLFAWFREIIYSLLILPLLKLTKKINFFFQSGNQGNDYFCFYF